MASKLVLAVAVLGSFCLGAAAQCFNCAPIVKCNGNQDCYKFGKEVRPLVGTAKAGDYCWEYCWGKVNGDCKKDFYSTIYGALRCPTGQVCRYLKRGGWKCYDEQITLKANDLCWDLDWSKSKKMDMRNKYCPEGTTCSMGGVWNSNRKKFYCKPLPQSSDCYAVPGSNFIHFNYWPQTYKPNGGLPCGGVYSSCPSTCTYPTYG